MRQGLSQSTQLKQELKINPRLYQAMDLLYMPLLDLQQHLKQELLNNPFLDLVEDEEEDEAEQQEDENSLSQADAEKDREGEIDWEEILLDGFDTAGGRREEHEEREYYEPVTVATRDLSDHLRDQVSLLELTPRQMLLADEFIGNIADDGYLSCPLEDIVSALNDVVTQAAEGMDRDTDDLRRNRHRDRSCTGELRPVKVDGSRRKAAFGRLCCVWGAVSTHIRQRQAGGPQRFELQLLQESLDAVVRPSWRGRVSAWPHTEHPSISKCTQWVGWPQHSQGRPRREPMLPKPGA